MRGPAGHPGRRGKPWPVFWLSSSHLVVSPSVVVLHVNVEPSSHSHSCSWVLFSASGPPRSSEEAASSFPPPQLPNLELSQKGQAPRKSGVETARVCLIQVPAFRKGHWVLARIGRHSEALRAFCMLPPLHSLARTSL